jgi:hypothetical protein
VVSTAPGKFTDLDELMRFLRARGIREVLVAGTVTTSLAPGTQEVALRAEVVVSARSGDREIARYAEQVMPYVSPAGAAAVPKVPSEGEGLAEVRLAVKRQLRAHRTEYEAVVDQARARVSAQLSSGGFRVREGGE